MDIKPGKPAPYRFLAQPYYWLIQLIVAVVFGLILHTLVGNAKYLSGISSYGLTLGGIIAVALIVGVAVVLLRILRIQRLHNEPSWAWYLYIGLVLAPITALAMSYSDFHSLFAHGHYWPYFLSSVVLVLMYYLIPAGKLNLAAQRYAAGAVGRGEADKLDFASAAKNTAVSIRSLQTYVEVLALYGRMGDGKSSYARMLTEELCEDGTSLYTYISLTETNEAKDFSLLFSERWFDTLRQRYPKINPTNSLVLMKSILRETGHGWISSIMEFIATLGDGILKSKVKQHAWDASLGYIPKYTSSEIGQIFGNIYEVKEDRWIIVIDEIERAKFEEIYRVIEVIERFKAEGRSGLPVQLIFLLCIDPEELTNLLGKYEKDYPVIHLIKSFFIANPKSISLPLYLPLLDFARKQNYVLSQVEELISKYSINKEGLVNPDTGQESLEIYWAKSLVDPLRHFETDRKKAFDFTINFLVEESLRTVNRVMQKIDQFYTSFLDVEGKPNVNAIRFPDILAISYVSVKYPFIIDFLKQTISDVFYEEIDSQPLAMERAIMAGLQNDDNKPKERISEWLSRITEVEIPDNEKTIIEQFVALICYRYIEFLRGDGARQRQANDIERNDSLALYDNLSDYLKNIPGTTHSTFGSNYPIYQQHVSSGLPTNVHGQTLIEYSSFVRRYEVSNSNLHYDVAKRILEDLQDGQIKPTPKVLRDDLAHKATYEFEFQLLNTLMAYKNPLVPKATALFIDFLKSPDINTEAKVTLLGGQVNIDGSNSEIHSRLNEGFEKMLSHDKSGVTAAIRFVIKEFEDRYINKKESIYDHEGNFFYVLYQLWNGEVKNRTLKFWHPQLRRIARNGLMEDKLALELLWSRWPYDTEWQGYSDYLSNRSIMREKNTELYMPLKTLIEITKKTKLDVEELTPRVQFWEKIINDPGFKNDNKLEDDIQTVRSKLQRKYKI